MSYHGQAVFPFDLIAHTVYYRFIAAHFKIFAHLRKTKPDQRIKPVNANEHYSDDPYYVIVIFNVHALML